jgi:putative transposase
MNSRHNTYAVLLSSGRKAPHMETLLAHYGYGKPIERVAVGASRYLITCDALSTTKEIYAFPLFERAFTHTGVKSPAR